MPYGEGRFQLDGPDLTLAPKTALALGMVFHELATNAAKYGALGHGSDGKVQARWRVEDGGSRPILTLDWTESGGPRITPPERQGFGTRLIERSLKGELGGDAALSYQEEGFQCSLKAPLEPLNG